MNLKTIISIISFFTFSIPVFSLESPTKILVMPFENRAESKYYEFEQYIPSYLIYLIEELTPYHIITLDDYFNYEESLAKTIKNLRTQNFINLMALNLKTDFIIHGYYDIEKNNTLKVYVDVDPFTTHNIIMAGDTFFFNLNFNEPETWNLNDFITIFFFFFFRTDIQPGLLLLETDEMCRVFVDGKEYYNPYLQFKLPLPAGEHRLRLEKKEIGFELKESITIIRGIATRRDIALYTQVIITADKPCWVYINNNKPELTPLTKNLVSGKEYEFQVEYSNGIEASKIVWNAHMLARGEIIKHHCRELGTLQITCHPFFTVLLEGQILDSLPYLNTKILPGTYRLQFYIEDPERQQKWTFFDKTYEMLPYGNISLDMGDFGYRKNRWQVYIPFVSQFYNREAGKGILLLGLLAEAMTVAGYYSLMLDYNSRLLESEKSAENIELKKKKKKNI